MSNQITPKAGPFANFLQSGTITVSDGSDKDTLDMAAMGQYRKCSRLYRIGEESILYFYAEPWRRLNFPESYSGLFLAGNGQTEPLIIGYECGGSLRGDYVCFWYDMQDNVWKPGTEENWGGFGGNAYGGTIYTLENRQAISENSFLCVRQTGPDGEALMEYYVNDTPTSEECYHAVKERYRYAPTLTGLYGWNAW